MQKVDILCSENTAYASDFSVYRRPAGCHAGVRVPMENYQIRIGERQFTLTERLLLHFLPNVSCGRLFHLVAKILTVLVGDTGSIPVTICSQLEIRKAQGWIPKWVKSFERINAPSGGRVAFV